MRSQKKMYMYTMFGISTYPLYSLSCCHQPPPWDPSPPFFSVSFTFLFPKLPRGFLQSRPFSVGSFVSLFIIPPTHTHTEAVGSIRPGGLFFIVIHPADYTLLVSHCILSAGCHCEKQMPFLKKKWFQSWGKTKSTKFQSGFSVVIVTSDGEASLDVLSGLC